MPRIGYTAGSLLVPAGNVDVAQIAGVPSQLDDTDKLAVSLYGENVAAGDTAVKVTAPADGMTPDAGSQEVTAHLTLYNGATQDRQRNNLEITLLASAARVATTTTPDQINHNHHHTLLYLDITVIAVATTLTLEVQVKDPVSGGYFTVWTAAAAAAAVGAFLYSLAPAAATATYTEICNVHLGRTWRLIVTHSDADSITYSVAAIVTE